MGCTEPSATEPPVPAPPAPGSDFVGSSAMDLLVRLGGVPTIRAVSDALYDRLLADDELGPLFSSTHMPTLRRRLGDYLIGVCTGDVTDEARRLRTAHAGRDVDDRHFSIMASHLADVLDVHAVDADTAADLLDLIAGRRGDVVTGSHVVDEWDAVDDSI